MQRSAILCHSVVYLIIHLIIHLMCAFTRMRCCEARENLGESQAVCVSVPMLMAKQDVANDGLGTQTSPCEPEADVVN